MVRAKTGHNRCDTCRLHPSVCICSQLPSLELKTVVTMIIWNDERFKTTNTGMLALACLARSIHYIYAGSNPLPDRFETDEEQPILLFPTEDAVPIENFVDHPKPIRLIVPDGTWRQASKVGKRLDSLKHVPGVFLPEGPPSRYTVRTGGRDGAVCTMEAVARALGILEGPKIQAELEHVFNMFMDRLNWIRGTLPAELVYGGIPSGAVRHDPRSGL